MAEKTFKCALLTGEAVVLSVDAESVIFPAPDGLVGVLPERAPLASVLGKGPVVIRSSDKTYHYSISGGVAHMRGQTLTLLADECRPVE